jgi:hypothetical protein
MKEGYSIRQLATQSGYSQITLRRIIHYWLARPPKLSVDLSRFKHLVVDGSYLEGRRTSVVVIADPTCNCVVTGWYGLKEGEARMKTVCQQLAQQGLNPISVTLDGLKQVQTMMLAVGPQVVIQRCLVHIQRQGLAWCRHQPKRPDAIQLRSLFRRIMTIRTVSERDLFIADWNYWLQHYGPAITASTDTSWTFSDLKRAKSVLTKALPDIFCYLDNPQILTSTNWIESYFGRLKGHYRQHRGLAVHQRENYFAWYFKLCPK